MRLYGDTPNLQGLSLMSKIRGLTPAVIALVAAGGVFVAALTTTGNSVATAETIVADDPAIDAGGSSAPAVPSGVAAAAASVDHAAGGATQSGPAPMLPAAQRAHAPVASALPVAVSSDADPVAAMDASLGFDPAAHGFSFDNWSGTTETGRVTVAMMVRMFGATSVCNDGNAAPCAPTAGAQHVLDAVNAGLETGRCDAMVAMAALAFESGRTVAPESFAAAQPDIAYWALSQVMPRVAARQNATRTMTPREVVGAVVSTMKKGRSVTLTLDTDSVSHSVLPVAVATEGSTALVTVYDPNFAGTTKVLKVDTASGEWSYGDAIDRAGNAVRIGGRGAGGLGFVENSLRNGTQNVRFDG